MLGTVLRKMLQGLTGTEPSWGHEGDPAGPPANGEGKPTEPTSHQHLEPGHPPTDTGAAEKTDADVSWP